MKKLIGIILFFAVVGGAVIMRNSLSKDDKNLRAAFPAQKPVSHYEPANIHFVYQYIFLENTFSTLVEMDPVGKIRPAVAESYAWNGDNLNFKIREGLRTENGTAITADDVVFSLKRLMVLSSKFKNTHGNFKELVCPTVDLKSVSDDCPGIRLNGNVVTLNVGSRKPFLIPMLTAIDFAIIPRSSVDPSTLEIKNFKETSGIYYVNRDGGDGHIELKMNPNHFRAGPDLAQSVELVPFDLKDPQGAVGLFDKGLVDHIMVSNGAKVENLLRYAQGRSDVQVHATMNIKKFMLVFTERGQRELSLAQRRWIGKQVRDAMLDLYKTQTGYEPTNEFFMESGDGALTNSELDKLSHVAVTEVRLPTSLRIGLIRTADVDFWAKPIRERIPNAKVYQDLNIPDLHVYDKSEEMPHAFIAGTDTGFLEDINLISYSLNTGFLGLSKPERVAWLDRYMGMEDSEARKEALRDLHFHALESSITVPLVACPFVAIIRKPWRMEFSQVFSNNQLWLIKHL